MPTISDALTGTPGNQLNGNMPVLSGIGAPAGWNADPSWVYRAPSGVHYPPPMTTASGAIFTTDISPTMLNSLIHNQTVTLGLTAGSPQNYQAIVQVQLFNSVTFKSSITYIRMQVDHINCTVSAQYSSIDDFVNFPNILVVPAGSYSVEIRINYFTGEVRFFFGGSQIGVGALTTTTDFDRVQIEFGLNGTFSNPNASLVFGGLNSIFIGASAPVLTYEYSNLLPLGNFARYMQPFTGKQ